MPVCRASVLRSTERARFVEHGLEPGDDESQRTDCRLLHRARLGDPVHKHSCPAHCPRASPPLFRGRLWPEKPARNIIWFVLSPFPLHTYNAPITFPSPDKCRFHSPLLLCLGLPNPLLPQQSAGIRLTPVFLHSLDIPAPRQCGMSCCIANQVYIAGDIPYCKITE